MAYAFAYVIFFMWARPYGGLGLAILALRDDSFPRPSLFCEHSPARTKINAGVAFFFFGRYNPLYVYSSAFLCRSSRARNFSYEFFSIFLAYVIFLLYLCTRISYHLPLCWCQQRIK